MQDRTISDQLQRAKAWLSEGVPLVNGISFESTPRRRLATAFHHLAIEHYAGIVQLVERGQHTPAFALYRPQLDAFVRGAWFRVCASDDQVTAFLEGKLALAGIHALVRDLERGKAFQPGQLQDAKDNIYDHLCDLTHGGIVQILARTQGDEIQSQFKSEHVDALLFSTGGLSLLSCMDIGRTLEDWDLFEQVSQAHMRIFDWEATAGA